MTNKKTTRKKRTTKKKLSNDPVTISEFQSWLSGVVEFQAKDWTPNKQQWEAILNKINNLTNETQTVTATDNTQPNSQNNAANQSAAPRVDMSNHRRSFLNPNAVVGQSPAGRPTPVQINDESTHVEYIEEKAPSGAPVPDGKVIRSNAPAVKTEHMAPNENSGKSSFE